MTFESSSISVKKAINVKLFSHAISLHYKLVSLLLYELLCCIFSDSGRFQIVHVYQNLIFNYMI